MVDGCLYETIESILSSHRKWVMAGRGEARQRLTRANTPKWGWLQCNLLLADWLILFQIEWKIRHQSLASRNDTILPNLLPKLGPRPSPTIEESSSSSTTKDDRTGPVLFDSSSTLRSTRHSSLLRIKQIFITLALPNIRKLFFFLYFKCYWTNNKL